MTLADLAHMRAELPPKKPPQRVDLIAAYDRIRPMMRVLQNETWQHKYDRLYRELPRGEWFGKRRRHAA